MTLELTSRRHEVADPFAAIEHYFEQGWTDGLPVVPPTESLVREFLEAAGLRPDEVLGSVPNRGRTITAEKVAINAVMSGCLPSYMPVVVAAVRAMADPRFNLHGSMASTGGAGPIVIVSGPVAKQIGLNSADNVFGPGWRANATIGRTMRLVLMNICAAQPGVMDKSTHGHPGKYSYCIAEREEIGPWKPLHVERGLPDAPSAVTVFAAQGPWLVRHNFGNDPKTILSMVADVLTRTPSRGNNFGIVVSPEVLDVCVRDGWTKANVREFLAEQAVRSVADLKRHGWQPGAIEAGDESKLARWIERLDDLLVVVAGGATSGTISIVPGWGGRPSSPVTLPVAG